MVDFAFFGVAVVTLLVAIVTLLVTIITSHMGNEKFPKNILYGITAFFFILTFVFTLIGTIGFIGNIITDSNEPPSSNTVSRSQLDAIFGTNNWYCFGNMYADVAQGNSPDKYEFGIKQTTSTSASSPIEQISCNGCSSNNATGGSAKLRYPYYIPTNQCPSWQLNDLDDWYRARNASSSSNFSNEYITNLVGSNWQCNNNSFTVLATLSKSLEVGYPITFVTGNSSSRDYGVGETVPANTDVVVWIDGTVSGCN